MYLFSSGVFPFNFILVMRSKFCYLRKSLENLEESFLVIFYENSLNEAFVLQISLKSASGIEWDRMKITFDP